MMKHFLLSLSIFSFFSLFGCNKSINDKHITLEKNSVQQIGKGKLDTAYFASGCFWCVEAIFESVNGVKEAVSGYSGGEKKNPTYREVSSGSLKHAEAVKVIYDPKQVTFNTLVRVFFGSHNPTTVNRQGPDSGPQYRSIAFYQSELEKSTIDQVIKALDNSDYYGSPVVTEVKQFEKFWEAEEYHQDYERRNPDVPYVKSVSIPRLNQFKQRFPDLLKENH